MAEEVKAKAAPKKTAAEKPAAAKKPAEKAAAAPKAEAKKPEAKKAQAAGKKIKVTLVRSTIGCLQKQKRTVEALGLKKIRSSKVHEDNACIRGMIFIVKHLVKVEEV